MRSQQSEFQQVIHKLLVLNDVCDETGSRLHPLIREFADQVHNPFPGQEDYAPGYRVIHCVACGHTRTTQSKRLQWPCPRCRGRRWAGGYAPKDVALPAGAGD